MSEDSVRAAESSPTSSSPSATNPTSNRASDLARSLAEGRRASSSRSIAREDARARYPNGIRLDDPLVRLIVVNNVPYLDLETLGAGASSTVSRAEMLVPFGWEVTVVQRDDWKPPQPTHGRRPDGTKFVRVVPRTNRPPPDSPSSQQQEGRVRAGSRSSPSVAAGTAHVLAENRTVDDNEELGGASNSMGVSSSGDFSGGDSSSGLGSPGVVKKFTRGAGSAPSGPERVVGDSADAASENGARKFLSDAEESVRHMITPVSEGFGGAPGDVQQVRPRWFLGFGIKSQNPKINSGTMRSWEGSGAVRGVCGTGAVRSWEGQGYLRSHGAVVQCTHVYARVKGEESRVRNTQ